MSDFKVSDQKLENVLTTIEKMAGGDTSLRFEMSEQKDSLDAICYGINVLVQELTYQKELAEKANKSKSDFLAAISHEIRTPVTAIKGFAELIREDLKLNPLKLDFLNRLQGNTVTLLALINDLLDLSKLEAGKLAVEKQKLSPVELISDISNEFKHLASSKGLSFKVRFANDLPPFIETDALRVRQILTNIVGNAIKYTDEGSIVIEVALIDARESSKKNLSILVSDTGRGMGAEMQKNLFQPYSRERNLLSEGPAGTGLGLSLSKGLAGALGGDIQVKSSNHRGTTFEITLDIGAPCPKEETQRTAKIQEPVKEPVRKTVDKTALAGISILIAEDNEDLQLLFRNVFELAGATVELTNNGEEALRQAETGKHDVILMDVTMPKMTGIEATKILRKNGFKKPILALSAHAMKEQQAECAAAGCDDFITKPIDIFHLIAKVLQAIKPSEA